LARQSHWSRSRSGAIGPACGSASDKDKQTTFTVEALTTEQQFEGTALVTRSCSPHYRAAVELYRGELLPEDRFEDWAEGPRETFRERHLGLLMEYAEALSAQGEHTQAMDVVGAVTAADPFHEGAQRTLMTALAASGRRYQALAVFDRLREALTEEYAADPEPATRRLYRDLLTGGGAEPDTPPAAARESLRLEQTSFVGRRRELAEIGQALGRTRLVTLTGPGGAGKTRLAYQAAARLVDSYPDGVHVVELASLSRPELVAQTVASVLDVPLPETGTAEVRWPGSWPSGGCCWSWTTASTSWTPAPGSSPPCCAPARMSSCWPPAASRCGWAGR
jgi:tetratricopeptide (TPR) repeat protein